MGIAGWFATVFITFLLYNAYQTSKKPEIQTLPGFLVPKQVGKQRNTGGSNRDASMFTEATRRRAVIYAKIGSPKHVMRESTHTVGFTTGVVDLSLTGICERICEKIIQNVQQVCEIIYDGNGTGDPIIYDGNGGVGSQVLDGGYSAINIDMCNPFYSAATGGNANSAGDDILDGTGNYVVDGGTNVW